jgi:glycosyltransferase involved in cell wall biosynthesis
MRIGIISTMGGNPWGGSEELWAAAALEALEAGHGVFVSVLGWPTTPPKIAELERRGAKILRRYNPDCQFPRALLNPASSYRDLFKTNPDVIVISQGWAFDVVSNAELLELMSVAPIPFVLVCQFNDSLPLLTNGYTREHAGNIFARAFRVLFVSNQNRIDAERQLARKIPNTGLLLNPVNLSDRSYVPWPNSSTARFASVARLETRYKGQDLLLEALSGDQWKQRDWHLTLYGSGPDESYLRSLVNFFRLQDRITFAGHQSDIRAIWAEEQVLVMLSRAEGTPLALVEAMLCGRPAIVSDVGGNHEWVMGMETGFVAEAPVIGLGQAALEHAWLARQSWRAMGIQAHEYATGKISDSSFPRLLEILLEAGRHKRPADAAAGKELERLQQYRALMKPPIGKRVKCVAEAGALSFKRVLDRWRTARAESQEQLLIRYATPKRRH